jgi:hypothetical protein
MPAAKEASKKLVLGASAPEANFLRQQEFVDFSFRNRADILVIRCCNDDLSPLILSPRKEKKFGCDLWRRA